MLLLVAPVGPWLGLGYASAGGYRAFRHWRRATGHFTRKEAAVAQRENSSAMAWEQARALQASLA